MNAPTDRKNNRSRMRQYTLTSLLMVMALVAVGFSVITNLAHVHARTWMFVESSEPISLDRATVNRALAIKGLSGLATINRQPDPAGWILKHVVLQTDSSSNVVHLSIEGNSIRDKTADFPEILDAVASAIRENANASQSIVIEGFGGGKFGEITVIGR